MAQAARGDLGRRPSTGGGDRTAEGRDPFRSWAILELMGHRRLAGFVSEQEIGGAAFIRIDVPSAEGDGADVATQFYSPAAVYCITPTTEEMVRAVAHTNQVQPVTRWELRQLPVGTTADAHAGSDEQPTYCGECGRVMVDGACPVCDAEEAVETETPF